MSRQIRKQTAFQPLIDYPPYGQVFDAGTLANLPPNGAIGWVPGAFYIAYDQAGNANWYVNTGTNLSANFQLLQNAFVFTDITVLANTANAFYVTDGTVQYFTIDTRNITSGVTANLFNAEAPTFASATGSTYHEVAISPITVTMTGATTPVTALDGIGLYIGIPTVTDANVTTITTVSTLYVAAPAAAGGSAIITNSYAINTPGNVNIGGTLTLAGNQKITAGNLTVTGVISANAAASTIGYGVGAGGAITQGSSRTTGVTINAITGAITLVSAAGSGTAFHFTVTNSKATAGCVIIASVAPGSATDNYLVQVAGGGAVGEFILSVTDLTGTTTETPVINFMILEAASS